MQDSLQPAGLHMRQYNLQFFVQLLFCPAITLFNLVERQNYFFVRLLDYSIVLKARPDELIHESIALHYYESILR